MKQRTLCILGGSGFVGSHLIPRFIQEGFAVKVLSRRPHRHRELQVMPEVRLVKQTEHTSAALAEQFADADAVINLVGILNESGRSGHGFQQAHVELPRQIIAACRQTGVSRLLHMSALNADPEGPSHYLRTKGEAEALMHAAAGPDLHVASLRPSVIFGPGDSFLNRFAGILRMAPGVLPLACPHARFAPVYVGDVADAFGQALHTSAQSTRVDLCGPKAYTLAELVRYTADLLGKRCRVVGLNDRLSWLQARVFDYVPGKPFSMDNYRSMQRDSVCPEGTPPCPTALEAVAPYYLGHNEHQHQLQRYRQMAGRDTVELNT